MDIDENDTLFQGARDMVSQNPAAAWKMDKTRYKGLFTGTLPIRYRFENQFYVGSPIAMPHIFDGTFGGPFS